MPSAATADRRLIINADDFGLAPGVNAGVLEAIAAGVVTSISVMVNTPAFADGMRALAKLSRPPSVGLHLNLTAGTPLSAAADVPSLVDPRGRFHSLGALGARALAGRVRAADVERETRAQLAALRSAWPLVSHVDSHQHAHALPGILGAVRRAADVRWLRRPVEPALLTGRPGGLKRLALRLAWTAAGGAGHAEAQVRGIGMHGDRDYEAELLRVVGHLPPGLTELIVHPGHDDPAVLELDPYAAPRARELAALLGPALRHRLEHGDVRLGGFVEEPVLAP